MQEATASRLRAIGWIGLTLVGLFFLFAPVADIIGTHSGGLPPDHRRTFTTLAGSSIAAVKNTQPGVAHYLATVEYGYALHELTFGLLFLAIVVCAFRRGRRWAWIACWFVLVAALGYTFTFGTHDHTILTRSLIADGAVPLLLLISAPSFFRHGHPARP